ncbi:hypothetical protein FOL46_004022 [Perkinsus olseni]|uniref:Uncharacterized protein n=1 Tax=Perkinsus olseni TaxID=32597 RepID=A0A7J6MT45_PEROL|nr:hypothetical protein FOL46_004022 [Perkinsus olseni]
MDSAGGEKDSALVLSARKPLIDLIKMRTVEDTRKRLEELIQEHLRRNPSIAEHDGRVEDGEFRDTVRKQFRIF